ncbi:unnamed protein product [Miscanthus lutarioriparius]|uniref:Uncharacterized protein n=1 Tax=Miscanthus lutarioriparius TaxID=422564 RepID=A0A811NCC3_9POAL|nr:unnamed protein product [Miscanthus lutarioriparius]
MDTVKLEKESAKMEMESDNFVMSAKVQMDTVKLEKESVKVQMGSVKLEKESAEVLMGSVKLEKQGAKVEMDSVKLEESAKVEMDTSKELLDHKASFSDIEIDDETCWFQDGVDLRGHSQVEDDDFNDQVFWL